MLAGKKGFSQAGCFESQPNNSLNRSANSIAFIVNLSVPALCSRPVNSGVRFLLNGET